VAAGLKHTHSGGNIENLLGKWDIAVILRPVYESLVGYKMGFGKKKKKKKKIIYGDLNFF
jgi:hypothetical protein